MSAAISRLVSVGSPVRVVSGPHAGLEGVVSYIYVKWNRSETKVLYRKVLVHTLRGEEWVDYKHCELG